MTTEAYQKEAERLRSRMAAQARHLLNDEEEAEDIVQDALLRLWQMHDRLQMPLDGMAIVLVRNLAIDQLRRRRVTVDIGDYAIETSPADHERIERMMAIVDTLPDLPQTILRLRHMEGMEMKDIAQLTGMSEVAVRKALSRARMAVRQKYQTQSKGRL